LIRRILEGEWDDGKNLFSDDRIDLFVGYREERMKKLGTSRVAVNVGGMSVENHGRTLKYLFQDIDSFAVAMQRNLEFYHQKSMYRLRFPAPQGSAYKYLAAYEAITEAKKSLKEQISV
jgi:hypothetical protein